MVQAFIATGGSELDAFRAYAALYPDDCVLLVDTINTLESGVPNAIRAFEELRRAGHRPAGIRLDSGDLAYLSIRAAAMLDRAGFDDVQIVLSNKIDELVLMQVLAQIAEEAPRHGVDPSRLIGRLVYGVGTRLITSSGDSSLDGVYKLTAVEDGGRMVPAIKLSETPEKTLIPGVKGVWRLYDTSGMAVADCLSAENEDLSTAPTITLHHPFDITKSRDVRHDSLSGAERLHTPVLREGRRLEEPPTLDRIRARRDADLRRLDPGVKRLINPHVYHVSLTRDLWELRRELVAAAGRGAGQR
jgi:nicotinate phosphoribosyltransferase